MQLAKNWPFLCYGARLGTFLFLPLNLLSQIFPTSPKEACIYYIFFHIFASPQENTKRTSCKRTVPLWQARAVRSSYRENTLPKVWQSFLNTNTHTMELFLLFSLALTIVAFVSIVLAEPPVPLSATEEPPLPMGSLAPIANSLTDFGLAEARPAVLQSTTPELLHSEYPVASYSPD